jgi:hypothetical protein
MNVFISYLKNYFREIRLTSFIVTTLFVALLILLNYRFGIEKRIRSIHPWWLGLSVFFIFYLVFFSLAILLQYTKERGITELRKLICFVILATFLFALKIIHWEMPSFVTDGLNYPWNSYFAIILQLPLKLLMILIVLYFLWKSQYPMESFFGLSYKQFDPKPYFLMLLFVIPLICFASTQAAFLQTYPKVKNISFLSDYTESPWLFRLIYEITYGLDFVSIELFFRGFLVIGFIRFAGINSILPMAAFYCTVHFGKPLAECISSYFGAIILGIIAFRTKSIVGGLLVHLGLAWMMEIGGALGHIYFNSR